MDSVKSAITNTVSISQFNRGMAGQIFSDVKENGPKVVMKNNVAEAVIMPPDKYVELMDMLEDYHLLTLAVGRLKNNDPEAIISEEEMMNELGITKEEIESAEDVEIE